MLVDAGHHVEVQVLSEVDGMTVDEQVALVVVADAVEVKTQDLRRSDQLFAS